MFTKTRQLITAELKSALDIDHENQGQLYESYLSIFKIRHNILHYSCFELTKKFEDFVEKPASFYFKNLPSNIKNKSPDMIKVEDNTVFICDFAVTNAENFSKEYKTDKYNNLIEELKNRNYNVRFQIFICDSRFSNLEIVFNEFLLFLGDCPNELSIETSQILLLLEDVYNTQHQIKVYIKDHEMLGKIMQEEFGLEWRDQLNMYVKDMTDDLSEKIKIHPDNITLEKIWNQGDQFQEKELETFENLLKNKEVISKMKEVATTSQHIRNSYTTLKDLNNTLPECNIKPSIHLFTPCETEKHVPDCANDKLRLEQQQIYNISKFFSELTYDLPVLSFVKSICKDVINLLDNKHQEFNQSIFNTGLYINEEINTEIQKKYNEYKLLCKERSNKLNSKLSFVHDSLNSKDFLPQTIKRLKYHIPKDGETRMFRQKMIKINFAKKEQDVKDYWQKAHSGIKKGSDLKVVKDDRMDTVNLNIGKHCESFLDLLATKYSDEFTNDSFENFMQCYTDFEETSVKKHKESMNQHYNLPWFNYIKKTVCYKFLKTQSLCYEQLMHFFQLSLPSNTFSLFTAGNPNCMTIVCNSFHDQGKDIGKAFMTIGIVENKEWLNPMFGKLIIKEVRIEGQVKYIFLTNWRRLSSTKVTFLKDQFYSVLSTTMNALTRHTDDLLLTNMKRNTTIRHHFCIKTMIAFCSNQRVAELLTDFRYGIMASLSDFSMVELFFKDKFAPPYKSCIETWIIGRILQLAKMRDEFNDYDTIFIKQPVFINKKRHDDSVGGKIALVSCWSNYINEDVQDFLDDLFLYVHTMKEPSNLHHENIKALNTILEYQSKYESLSVERQNGIFPDYNSVLQFILDDNIIGHSHHITMKSVESYLLSHYSKFDFKKVWESVRNEPLSSVTSTKAVIPEYERIMVKQQDNVKKTTKAQNRKLKKEDEKTKRINTIITHFKNKNITVVRKQNPLNIKTNSSKSSILLATNRVKVHDAITDFLTMHPHVNTSFGLCCWNIFENNCKVVADICIKAQYGSKREFYVLNLGAKLMARIVEKLFEYICRKSPNEMISVPGDKKILEIQQRNNDILLKKTPEQTLFFVNGDCTKWSAAETMQSFMSMIEAFKSKIPLEAYNILKITFLSWMRKEITIPISILQNIKFITNYTSFLQNECISMSSTQNFLQGMFNYSSSFKAVCSSNYTNILWKKLRPKSTLRADHLEHSDDYNLQILCNTKEELLEYRILHRIIMKCHGFNDSIKKTNTQQFLSEFLSLCSFNGNMTYPHIKKTKEMGMNLGCTGYRDDMDAALSRIGESVRVGQCLNSAYFSLKLHIYNVARSYSIVETKTSTQDLINLQNRPIELFGIPDVHPIFIMLTKGTPNNYRLYKYGNDSLKKIIADLLKKEIILNSQKSNVDFNIEGAMRLYHPEYSFDIENKLIKKIRTHINCDFEDIVKFWNDHKSYHFIKPINSTSFLMWLKSMYFKHSFALAYSRNSRAQITLRLSTFSKTHCLIEDSESCETFTKISDYLLKNTNQDTNELQVDILPEDIVKFSEQLDDNKFEVLLNKTITNCDSTLGSIYSFFTCTRFLETHTHSKKYNCNTHTI